MAGAAAGRATGARIPIRVAARPAGARRFGAPHTVGISADELLDAVVGPNGDAAFLMFHGNTAYVVRRTRDGALLPRLAIHGAEQSGYGDGSEESSARHTLAVTASGAVLIATGDQAGGRLLQIAPDGTQSVVAESPGCDADGVVVNRAGAGLMTLRCARTRAVQTFTVPQAAAARAHVAAAAEVGARRVIASGRGVARLSAYGGALVFSRRDARTRRWSLDGSGAPGMSSTCGPEPRDPVRCRRRAGPGRTAGRSPSSRPAPRTPTPPASG